MQLPKETENILQYAMTLAKDSQNIELTLEHLLLALLSDSLVNKLLISKNIEKVVLETLLKNYIKNLPMLDNVGSTVQVSGKFDRVLQRTIFNCLYKNKSTSKPLRNIDILSFIYSEDDSYATRLLKESCLTRSDVNEYCDNNL